MTIEQLLSVPCKHGNLPIVVQDNNHVLWRALCPSCGCGRRAKSEQSPIWAAAKWHREHHRNTMAVTERKDVPERQRQARRCRSCPIRKALEEIAAYPKRQPRDGMLIQKAREALGMPEGQ